MERINENRAIELIGLGFFPQCEVSRDVFRFIRSCDELEMYKHLSSSQMFILWGYTEEELNAFSLSNKESEVSLDEASHLLLSHNPIYGKAITDSEEVSFTSIRELIEFYKECNISGEPFHLYTKR